MARYLLTIDFRSGIVDTPMSEWTPEEITAHLDYYRALHQELIGSGELVESTVLTGPDLAKIVTSDGEAFLRQVGDETQVRSSARPHRA